MMPLGNFLVFERCIISSIHHVFVTDATSAEITATFGISLSRAKIYHSYMWNAVTLSFWNDGFYITG